MKISDVPDEAFATTPTPIPIKVVYDWDKMFNIMREKGFVIIESDDIRTLKTGAEESAIVKMFNSHVALTKKQKLRTKRISKNRWYCTL